jgi:hypothetical protein
LNGAWNIRARILIDLCIDQLHGGHVVAFQAVLLETADRHRAIDNARAAR